jgi:hypothetical protein
MALITYVDDKRRKWELSPQIAVLTEIDDYLALQRFPDILIIHGGHKNGAEVAPSGQYLLVEAVLHACKRGGRAIIFSGGQPRVTKQDVAQALGREGFHDGADYIVLTAVENLLQEIDIEQLEQVNVVSGWNISSVKRRHAAPALLALALLCQAALLAVEPATLDPNTLELLGGLETVEKIRARCAGLPAKNLLTPHVWRAAFSDSTTGQMLMAIHQEWPAEAANSRDVERLVTSIYENPAAFHAKTMSAAYRALHNALAINQQQQAL